MKGGKRDRDEHATPDHAAAQSDSVRISGVDMEALQNAWRTRTGSDDASVTGVHRRPTGKVMSAILNDYVTLVNKDKKPRVSKSSPVDPGEAADLVNNPSFQRGVVQCGVHSYKDLREADDMLKRVLPSYDAIWKAKRALIARDLLPLVTVHGLGLELDPQKMMQMAIDVFALWDARMVSFRWHFDTAASGLSVFGMRNR